MKCPNCNEPNATLEETTQDDGSLRNICTACKYAETR